LHHNGKGRKLDLGEMRKHKGGRERAKKIEERSRKKIR